MKNTPRLILSARINVQRLLWVEWVEEAQGGLASGYAGSKEYAFAV